MSERTLCRPKELTGLTPARQLLEAQTLPTAAEVEHEIYLLIISQFSQLYSKRFGQKPSEY